MKKDTINPKEKEDVGRRKPTMKEVLKRVNPLAEKIAIGLALMSPGTGILYGQQQLEPKGTKTEQNSYSFSFVTGQVVTDSDLKKAFSGEYCLYWDVKDSVSSGGYWDTSSGDSIWVDLISLKRIFRFEIGNLMGACTLESYQQYIATPDFSMKRSDDYLVTFVDGFDNRSRIYNYDSVSYKGRGTEILVRNLPSDPRGSYVDGIGVMPIVSSGDTVGIAVLYKICYVEGGASYSADLFFSDTKTVLSDKLIPNLK